MIRLNNIHLGKVNAAGVGNADVGLTFGRYNDPDTGFHLVTTPEGKTLRIAVLVDDDAKRIKVSASLRRPEAKKNLDFVDIIIALGMGRGGNKVQ